tara:strand:+ start:62 stop:643 length:582 start_codon:yes stop_codon:yes gene_type:complete
MQVQITGKNVDIGDALKSHIKSRLNQDVVKYFDDDADGHVTVAKEGSEFRSDCSLVLRSGISLQSHGLSADAYASFDIAAEKLEKRLRRYTRRLKNHRNKRTSPVRSMEFPVSVISPDGDDEKEAANENPVIIAETSTEIQDLTVSEAVMKMDISDMPFVIFRNGKNHSLNIVYRREDNNIGWIDPEQTTASS